MMLDTVKILRDDLSLDLDQRREAIEAMGTKFDFDVGNYRFIHEDHIDAIQLEELESDTYALGCLAPWLIANVTKLPETAIEAMVEAEAFEAIGEIILSLGKVADLQREYVRHDGYGHHFAHYDHQEHEIGKYYAFRVN